MPFGATPRRLILTFVVRDYFTRCTQTGADVVTPSRGNPPRRRTSGVLLSGVLRYETANNGFG